MITRMVTGDAAEECARMRYGLRQLQSTYKRSQSILLLFARATQSSPKPQKLTPPPRASQQAVSQPASGVRYTGGHYTCSTADRRALCAAGYDSSSSRQTIRYQRRLCSAETDSRETSARRTARPLRVLCPPSSPAPFQRASRQLLRIFI